jgi:hypothetical protein
MGTGMSWLARAGVEDGGTLAEDGASPLCLLLKALFEMIWKV